MTYFSKKDVENMSLQDLCAYSLELKGEITKNPNSSNLKNELEKVDLERKKKKLKGLLKDLEIGGPNYLNVKPEIDNLRKELGDLGVNVSVLESSFMRQSLYI